MCSDASPRTPNLAQHSSKEIESRCIVWISKSGVPLLALLSSSVLGGLICAAASAQFAMDNFFGGGGKRIFQRQTFSTGVASMTHGGRAPMFKLEICAIQ
jgi:hypothetical protein